MATPLHSQPQDDETFYLLEGNLTFYLGDGRPLRASFGATVHVPRGAAHAYRVESKTARMLVLTTPQHERFFRAAGEPARARTLPPPAPPDMGKVMAAAEKYGVEILGPRPGTPRPREGSLLSIATRGYVAEERSCELRMYEVLRSSDDSYVLWGTH